MEGCTVKGGQRDQYMKNGVTRSGKRRHQAAVTLAGSTTTETQCHERSSSRELQISSGQLCSISISIALPCRPYKEILVEKLKMASLGACLHACEENLNPRPPLSAIPPLQSRNKTMPGLTTQVLCHEELGVTLESSRVRILPLAITVGSPPEHRTSLTSHVERRPIFVRWLVTCWLLTRRATKKRCLSARRNSTPCVHVRASTAGRTHQTTLPDRGRLVPPTQGRQLKTGRSGNICCIKLNWITGMVRGGLVGRLLAFPPGRFVLRGSIPGRVAPRYSHVGIVPDDTLGPRVISRFSRFPRLDIPALLHDHLASL
ncbi:hypothetical protein PR048_005235 [Dryococelus australis]|uniref:Uncharacterized protein n=1 Tax=Dryococelus australis TaxID=614101 RepID=A0ABQ9I7M0_9NEOP|nr:hypothetical protein PR048_005235 [Dryococelus australis]